MTGHLGNGLPAEPARTLRRTLDGRTFHGDIVTPGDDRYDAERLSWHRTLDPRPAIVAEADDTADVRATVVAARERGVPLAVQATGHGTVTPADGALLLKTARMAEVEVDPLRRVARAGPGALWSAVVAAAAPFGLAPLSGSAPVGVAGYTLGGGAGLLSRKYGFAADSLLRAEIVTAAGQVLTASAEEHPDLFWALRGGGGNFGVVTSLEFRLYPVIRVYTGMLFYDIKQAPEALACYREWAPTQPDELSTTIALMAMPSTPEVPEPVRGRRVLGINTIYLGEGEDAEGLLDPLLGPLGEPLVDGFRSMKFTETPEAAGPPPPPMATTQHMDLFRELPDSVIDVLVEAAAGDASPVTGVDVRYWGGAMGRPAPDAGPAGHRDVPFSAVAVVPVAGPHDRVRGWSVMDELAQALRPYATGGSFLNYLTDPARTSTAFTPENYRRLVAAKRTWDPDNLFRLNHNIPPS